MKWLTMNTRTGVASLAMTLTFGTVATACSSRRGEGAASKADSATATRAGTLEGPTQNTGAANASADSGMQAKTKGMPGMSGMSDMSGTNGKMSGMMMEQMQAHLRMLDGVSGDSMMAMLGMHRSMVANMISQATDEMRKMNMPASPVWQATTDSLRQDLVRLPEMSASQLHSFMPAHRARIMRLMEMHRSMMSGMKPGMKM